MEKISRRGFGLALLSSLGVTNLGFSNGFCKKTEDVFVGPLGHYVKREVTGCVTVCDFNDGSFVDWDKVKIVKGITCWDEYPYKHFDDAKKYKKPVLCFPMENKLEIYYERGIETYICFNLKRKQKERILQMPIAELLKILKREKNEYGLHLSFFTYHSGVTVSEANKHFESIKQV